MKLNKRIISVALVFVFALSAFTTVTFAAPQFDFEEYVTICIDAGDDIHEHNIDISTVSPTASTDPAICGMAGHPISPQIYELIGGVCSVHQQPFYVLARGCPFPDKLEKGTSF